LFLRLIIVLDLSFLISSETDKAKLFVEAKLFVDVQTIV